MLGAMIHVAQAASRPVAPTAFALNDLEDQDDLGQLRRLVRALAHDRAVGPEQVPRLMERGWVREVHAGQDFWLELTEAGREALANAVEPLDPAAITPDAWAQRFAARRALCKDLSTPEELVEDGRRLFPILGHDMSPEAAADAVSSQWGDL